MKGKQIPPEQDLFKWKENRTEEVSPNHSVSVTHQEELRSKELCPQCELCGHIRPECRRCS